MKNRRLLAISSLFLAATVCAGVAGSVAANTAVDAGAAFSRLKALVGDWDVESSQGKGHSSFELIAGGSVLLERFAEPGGQVMLTAYHLDGSRLVLTHYCIAGNQPQMVAEKFDGASGELDFAFRGGSNIASGAVLAGARFVGWKFSSGQICTSAASTVPRSDSRAGFASAP